MALAAVVFGLAIGLTLGTLGGGGSVLAVPVLVYVLGQGVHEATTSSLVIVTAGALAGGAGHALHGNVCWRHAAGFAVGALPGVVAGTALGDAVGGQALLGAFAVIMLAAAAATWRRASAGDRAPGLGGERPGCPPLRLARDLAAGAGIGVLTGFFGVGGGFLIVPTLAIALSLSMRMAVGTSLAIATATSLLALSAHLAAGRGFDVDVTLLVTAGCVVGAVAGARVAGRLSQELLGHAFAVLLVGVAAYLLVSVAFLGGPPA